MIFVTNKQTQLQTDRDNDTTTRRDNNDNDNDVDHTRRRLVVVVYHRDCSDVRRYEMSCSRRSVLQTVRSQYSTMPKTVSYRAVSNGRNRQGGSGIMIGRAAGVRDGIGLVSSRRRRRLDSTRLGPSIRQQETPSERGRSVSYCLTDERLMTCAVSSGRCAATRPSARGEDQPYHGRDGDGSGPSQTKATR